MGRNTKSTPQEEAPACERRSEFAGKNRSALPFLKGAPAIRCI